MDCQLGLTGTGPGQFDTPHGVAVSPKDEVFVADRGNRRIQVFDTEGTFIRQFTIDVPVDTQGARCLWRAYAGRQDRVAGARRARRALHDAGTEPGALRGRFVSEPYLQSLARRQGAGRLWRPGRNLGEFGWIHAIACPSENEIWVGELINWRVQKLVTKGGVPCTASR